MESTLHKINLTNGAARWLAIYLNNQGILNTTAEVFLVGTLLASHLDAAINLPEEKTKGEAWNEWQQQKYPEFEISESQRDAIKKGLQELAKKSALVPNKQTVELLPIFGCPIS